MSFDVLGTARTHLRTIELSMQEAYTNDKTA